MKPRASNPFCSRIANLAVLFVAPFAHAADGTWNGISGNWTDTTDPGGVWVGGIIADGTGSTANFTGIDIAADQIISLNGNRTIGNIIFTDDTTSSNNLAITGNILTLDVASGVPIIDVTQSDRTLTIGSIVAGNDGLQKNGAGNLTLTGANTFTGTTTVSAGTLQIGSGGGTGSLASTAIVNDANLVYNLDTTGTASMLSGGLTGSGNLSATAGVIQFNGNITQGGALSFTQVGTASLYKGLELVAASTTLTGSSITLSGDVGKRNSNGNSLALNTSASNGTIDLDISLGRNGVWYSPSAFSANAGTGAINITGSGVNDTGWRDTPVTLTGAVNMTGNVNSGASVTIDSNTTTTGTGAGVFSGGMSLTKSGAGTLTLAGQNSFTGTLNVNGGVLEFSNNDNAGRNVFGSTQININNGATLRISGALGNIEIFKGRTYTFDSGGGGSILLGTGNYNATTTAFGITTNGGARNNIGLITTSGAFGFNLGSAVATFNVALGTDATSDLTVTPIIANGGSIVKSGAGRLTFAGANTYSGATTVSGGTLIIQNTSASATHSIASGATLELNYANSISSGTTTFSGAGTLSKTGAGTALWGGSAATFALGSGSLIDVQGGTFTGGSNANEVWTGNLSDLNVASGAIFDGVEANVRVNKITGTGTIRTGFGGAGYAVFTVGVDDGSSQFGGVIANSSATGNIAKAGSGTITLTNANTYTGTTTVNGGTLVLSGAGNSNSTSGIAIANSANLTFAATDTRSFTKAITGTAGDITFNVAGNTSDTGGGNATNFAFNNTGTAFTGNIVINTGLVSPSSDAAFGNAANPIKLNAASGSSTGLVATANLSLNRPIELVTAGGNGIFRAYNGATLTLGGVISGSGNFVKTDGGTVILNNANTFTGSTRVGAGPLHLGNSLALQNSTLQSAVTFLSSVGSNAFTLGGLSGSNNQALQNSAAAAIALSVGNNNADTTYSGVLSTAGGSLVKIGAGNLTLSNQNTFAGGTTIDNGTLTLGHATDTLADGGAVNVNGGTLALGTNTDTVGAVTLTSGSITGTGTGRLTGTGSAFDVRSGTIDAKLGGTVGLNKTTGGTVTINSDNSTGGYTGATTVSAGTLLINGNISTSTLTTVSGTGTLGGNGFVGNTRIQTGGTLSPGNSIGELGINGSLTLDSGSFSLFEIDTTGDLSDLAIVTGLLTFGGTLNVNNVGASLVSGDVFDLFNFTLGNQSGTFFAVNLPALDPGLTWDQSQLYTAGTLTIIPEPSVAALLGSLALLTLLRRRRN